MQIHWLEQSCTDVPRNFAWLSDSEHRASERLHFAKRRSDWLLGRWTAKLALCTFFGLPVEFATLARIEVIAEQSGAPQALVDGAPVGVEISLSHSGGTALCAIAPATAKLGCDIEAVERRSLAFINDYFTDDEQQVFACAPRERQVLLANLIWSAKESALKSLRVGLRESTCCVEVITDGVPQPKEMWSPLFVQCSDGLVLHGFWCHTAAFVRTVTFISDNLGSMAELVPCTEIALLSCS